MKRKRIVSVMLVAAMAATLFAGCGNKGGSNSSTQGERQQTETESKSLPHSSQYRDLRSMMTMRSSRLSLRRPESR